MSITLVVLEKEALGEEEEAELINWLVEDGETVNQDQPIAEVETAKAVLEIAAPIAGRLRHIGRVGDLVAAEAALGEIAHE